MDNSNLIGFWDDLTPVIKVAKEIGDIIQQPIRKLILDVLTQGIHGTTPQSQDITTLLASIQDQQAKDIMRAAIASGWQQVQKLEKRTRYALSAEEIKDRLYEVKENVTLANVYFHLRVLRDNDLVQIVTEIKKDGRTINYYGKTAKLFIYGAEQVDTHDDIYVNILAVLRPEIDNHRIREIHEKIKIKFKNNLDKRIDWINKHQRVLQHANVDQQVLFNHFQFILALDPEFRDLIEELFTYLGYS